MFAFFLKILSCLLIAAAIGFLLAWLLRGLALGRIRDKNYRLSSDLSARDKQVIAAQGQAHEARGKLATAEHDLVVARARSDDLELALQGEQQRSAKLNEDLRHERERYLALEGAAKQRGSEIEALRLQLANTTRDKDFEIVRLGSQLAPLAALPAALTSRDTELKSLQARYDELNAAHQRATAELELRQAGVQQQALTAEQEISRRGARIAELERDAAAHAQRQQDLDTLARSRAEQIIALQTELQSLRGQMAAIGDSKDTEVRALQSRLNESSLTLRQREQELAGARKQIESELAALRSRGDADAGQFKSRVATLTSDLQARDSTLSTLRVELDAARKTLDSRSALLRDLEGKHATTQDALRAKDAELARLRSEISLLTPLSAKLASLESAAATDKDRVLQLERELQTLGNDRRNEQWQHQQSQSGLEQQLADCAAARRKLEAELEGLRSAQPVSKRPPRQFASAPPLIDDLKHIYGVGPALEKVLHGLGVYQFIQVATWTPADIAFFDAQLHEFHGRIEREHWVRSAQEEHYKKYGEWLGDGDPKITMPETNR